MPIQGFDADRCAQRNRVDTLRYGVNSTPLRKLATTRPPASETAGPEYAMGSLPSSVGEALRLINSNLPPNSPRLGPDDVYIHYIEGGSNRFVGDRFLFLGSSTLRNVARDAQAGIAFMNSHRTGDLSTPTELPFGRTFAGRYERYPKRKGKPGLERTMLGMYMVRGIHPNGANGPSTDDLNRMITSGTLFDVSMGINGGAPMCDICQNQVRSENCSHVPGTHRNMDPDQKRSQRGRGVPDGLASYTLEDGHAGEVSGVYDGAVPGAGFSKAYSLMRSHDLSSADLAQVKLSYGSFLNKGDHNSMDEAIENAPDSAIKRFFNRLVQFAKDNPDAVDEVPDDEQADGEKEPEQVSEDDATELDEEEMDEEAEGDDLDAEYRDEEDEIKGTQGEDEEDEEEEDQIVESVELKVAQRQADIMAPIIVRDLVSDHRLLPFEAPYAEALVKRAWIDDALSPTNVTFTNALDEELTLSRVALTTQLLGQRVPHDLVTDHDVTKLPEGSVIISALMPEKDPASAGLHQGKKFVEDNFGPEHPETQEQAPDHFTTSVILNKGDFSPFKG